MLTSCKVRVVIFDDMPGVRVKGQGVGKRVTAMERYIVEECGQDVYDE